MKKNKDYNMYIDYEKFNRRRGRKADKRWKVFLMVFISLGLVVTTAYSIMSRVDIEKYGNKVADDKDGLGQDIKDEYDEYVEVGEGAIEKGSSAGYTEEKVIEEIDTGPGEGENKPIDNEEIKVDNIGTGTKEEKDTRVPVQVKGLYISSTVANNSNKINKLMEVAENTEINALVIDVKDDDGKITYKMNSNMAQNIGATTNAIRDIEGLIKGLKEKGIYTIARIVAFKDPFLAESRHDLAIKNSDGSIYRDTNGECWVNPYRQEIWEYLIEVSRHVADIGFDEIQFDYIRFSTGRGMADVDFGEGSELKSKEDIIIEFTKYAYETLKPLGVFVSADVYGTIISSSIDAGLVGQDYVEMSKHLDYICPMIYPSHFGEGNYGVDHPDLEPFEIVKRVLEASQEKLDELAEGEHRAIVRPWLQDFTASWLKNYKRYGAEEIREQIRGVYAAGYDEWIFWNSSGNYTVQGFEKE